MEQINEKNIIFRVEIPDYIKSVVLARKRKAKYRINKDGKKVVSNPKFAGKPRVKVINGQDLWVGIDHNMRSKIAKEIKKYFYNIIKDLPTIEDYPIGVSFVYYGPLGDFDLDNLTVWYRKCFHDALSGNVDFNKTINSNGKTQYVPDRIKYPPKIIDDSVKYIRSMPTDFVESETSKLVITIFKL